MKFLLCFAAAAMLLTAQPGVGTVERKVVDKVDLDSKPFETWMTNAASFAANLPFDPKAQSLLVMAENATDSIFRLDSRRLRKKATQANVKEIGDMMMLHWDVMIDTIKGELILHDTAQLSSYALRLRGPLTADRMAEILPRILGHRFLMMIGPDSTRFTTPSYPRQFDVANSSQAVRTPTGDWIVLVHRDKGFLHEQYPTDVGKERFPPFGERIKSWSLERLTGTLHIDAPKLVDFANYVLLNEIAKRNPSPELWKDIVLQAASAKAFLADSLLTRCSSILSILRRQDPTNERAEAFRLSTRDTLRSLGKDYPRYLLDQRLCTPTYDRNFTAQLDDPALRTAALEYLSECSNLPEMYDRIKTMDLAPEHERARAEALQRIQDRQRRR